MSALLLAGPRAMAGGRRMPYRQRQYCNHSGGWSSSRSPSVSISDTGGGFDTVTDCEYNDDEDEDYDEDDENDEDAGFVDGVSGVQQDGATWDFQELGGAGVGDREVRLARCGREAEPRRAIGAGRPSLLPHRTLWGGPVAGRGRVVMGC